MPIYGKDVYLERFRPNGDKYSVGKVPMSLIKIHMSNFLKRIDKKFQLEQNFGNKAKKSINLNINNNSHINSPKSTSTNNLLLPYKSRVSTSKKSSYTIEGEYINKWLAS